MKNLEKIFENYQIKLDENQKNQFDLFYHFLVSENEKMNLTAITDEDEVIIKHFLDSVLPHKFFEQNAKVVDVGSGAGFPAIPLKILRSDLNFSLVDSLNKRVDFLNKTISLLKLDKISAFHSRVEDFAKDNREKFDIAIARAVAPLNTLVEYLLPLVKIGGKAIIYKSTKLEEELSQAQKAIKVLGGEVEKNVTYTIKEENLQRNILIVKKVASTPQKYPRPQNKPKNNPII